MADIKKKYDADEDGFTSNIDGASFSAPEQAGYVSDALYEQMQREDQGPLPLIACLCRTAQSKNLS